MTWFLTFLVVLLSAAAGLALAGFIANMAVDWYRISSFEGGSGYYVVFLAIGGGIAGGIIGLIVARMVAAGVNPGFFKALGTSLGVILVLGGAIGGVARLKADVAPEADGHGLLLAVEFRWPASQVASPATATAEGYTSLGSASSGVVRKSEDGPLFLDLARQEDGRWIVPGAAAIFTTRGNRVVSVYVDDKHLAGFELPNEGNAVTPQAEWSAWYPQPKSGAPVLPDQMTYRFRVMPTTEPVRTDSAGPFSIATITGGFARVGDPAHVTTRATFRISYRGQPLAGYEAAGSVAVIGGSRVALLAQVSEDGGEGQCMLITEDGVATKADSIGVCYGAVSGFPLTSDNARYHAARARGDANGWLDRATFAEPGLYLVNTTVLDTRTLFHRVTVQPDGSRNLAGMPPVSLSPDERSIAWIAVDGSDPGLLVVRDWKSDQEYTIPIDATVMRYRRRDDIDPQWVAHHFAWERGSDGNDRLAQRAHFTSLPYRGDFAPGRPGAVTIYSLSPGGEALRRAMVEVLLAQMGAQRQPDELDGYYIVLKIDGKTIKTTAGSSVSIAMVEGEGDPVLMTKIAKTLDAALATGKYDALFVADKP